MADTVTGFEQEMERTSGKSDGLCHCPLAEIEYLIGVDNLEAVNIKTGRCLRCNGTRLNKLGKILVGKRRIVNERPTTISKQQLL